MQLSQDLGKVHPFIWLSVASLVMMFVSLKYQGESLMSIWLITFLFGIVGYGVTTGLASDHYTGGRRGLLALLMVIYAVWFVRLAMDIAPNFLTF
ncbi:MAG: hypothetical protein AAB588_06145 [Patescibacteria group bacterium]